MYAPPPNGRVHAALVPFRVPLRHRRYPPQPGVAKRTPGFIWSAAQTLKGFHKPLAAIRPHDPITLDETPSGFMRMGPPNPACAPLSRDAGLWNAIPLGLAAGATA